MVFKSCQLYFRIFNTIGISQIQLQFSKFLCSNICLELKCWLGSHLYVACRSVCSHDQNWIKQSKAFLGDQDNLWAAIIKSGTCGCNLTFDPSNQSRASEGNDQAIKFLPIRNLANASTDDIYKWLPLACWVGTLSFTSTNSNISAQGFPRPFLAWPERSGVKTRPFPFCSANDFQYQHVKGQDFGDLGHEQVSPLPLPLDCDMILHLKVHYYGYVTLASCKTNDPLLPWRGYFCWWWH